MIRILAPLAAVATAVSAPAAAQAPATPPLIAVQAGHVLGPDGQTMRGPATIVVEGRRIREVRDGHVEVPGARVIDLRRAWVLPGLIDAHVHLTGQADKAKDDDALRLTDADLALRGAGYAARTLQAGFTTVRNLGGPTAVRALKNAIARGEAAGPTIIDAVRMISVTGGHGDVNGFTPDITHLFLDQTESVCNGPDDCRRATRAQIRNGADVIKLATTGGVMSNVAGGLGQQMTDDEAKAVIDTAHAFGRKVAAHAHGRAGIESALRLGIDSVEHGTYLDDATIALFKRSNAYLVPTLTAPLAVKTLADQGRLNPATTAKIAQVVDIHAQNVGKAIRAGVRIAFGTDNGVGVHGDNAQEFALMVAGGMTPAAAIRAATVNAADLLGLSDRIGAITAGRDADLIAVDADPMADVRALERVRFVMRHGVVHRADGAAIAR